MQGIEDILSFLSDLFVGDDGRLDSPCFWSESYFLSLTRKVYAKLVYLFFDSFDLFLNRG